MAKAKPSSFTAIIVGGSVAGLTLAHTLSRANINYILLEARDTLSPNLGAGIVVMPNGARILDQMGIWEPINDVMTPMGIQYRRRSDGTLVSQADFPKRVEERLGYFSGIMERQTFLQRLFEQLEDKSKVHLNKKVVSFNHDKEHVRVQCYDGSEFVGDIVVGADGIHSRTRQEMQRFAEEAGPQGMMDKDKTSITAQYNAFFGISEPLPYLSPGDAVVASDINHSSLLFVSKHGLPQWFFFSKMDKCYQGKDIPRFNKAQMEEQIDKFANWKFSENVSLKDLMAKTSTLSYLPLEEATHNIWTYKRFVCVGDAIHKMTPNMGQGGNQAIESAAALSNCLVEMLARSSDSVITLANIEQALQKYQKQRRKRAKLFVKLSGLVTRDETLDTLTHTLRFLFLDPWTNFQMDLYTMAPYLTFLPLPGRTIGNKYWEAGMKNSTASERPKARL
ncbi:hypothetical protein G7Y89_g864 [Cudoniella acicularis]|uniref:FAD-binding domain-containing protein n=1 Tax=Cudoniella acicularis TaxID=354080 RepID=A0A8H4RXD6_9HELO|nr:hypothetical protein G7Y89_g864 [Cudoniella acicularis]